MAQKDYVSRGRSGARRKNTGRKKSSPIISKTVVVLAVAVLVVFIGGLYFITHNKPEDDAILPTQAVRPGNGLPPKPEERWRYIKELENRQTGVLTPTEPTAGTPFDAKTQLTQEQKQLLEQMQSDMRQQPTQLTEIPYNADAKAKAQPPVAQPQPVPPAVSQQPVKTPQAQAQIQPKPKPEATIAPIVPEKEKSTPAAQEKTQRFMVQCGSFRGSEQAESVRAKLAFDGFEGRITSSDGWNRVVIGPYNNRAAAESTLSRLKSSGISGCIPLSTGG